MKLLQLNAWTLRLSTQITEMIKTETPDIVTLQEILEPDVTAGLFTSFSDLLKTVSYEHRYFSPVYSFRFMSGSVSYGNATISNLPLRDQETVFTHLRYKPGYVSGKDDYNIRNFQHVVAEDKNGKTFHVINHHGYHIPEHKEGNELTLAACQQIFTYVQKLKGPVIITGDFNLEPASESLAVFDGHFRNLTTDFGLTTTRNILTHKSEICDYVFVNEFVTVNDFHMSDIVASDHQGLVLDFDIK
jgi:endonuclease/exonuclease/phosphatase family metal-dependent hydrolase